jgi:hypothetical protein
MWAINSARHLPPIKCDDAEGWLIEEWKVNDDGDIEIVATTHRIDAFNYTFKNASTGERLTFVYDGASVKPMYRTLRKYGAEALQPIVARLANLNYDCEPGMIWKWLDSARTAVK